MAAEATVECPRFGRHLSALIVHPLTGAFVTDGAAIRASGHGLVPRGTFGEGELLPTRPAVRARNGNEVCFSGARSQNPNTCGFVEGREVGVQVEDANGIPIGPRVGGYWVKFARDAQHGDSGGPVWVAGNSGSLGLISAKFNRYTLVVPLVNPKRVAMIAVVVSGCGGRSDDSSKPVEWVVGEVTGKRSVEIVSEVDYCRGDTRPRISNVVTEYEGSQVVITVRL